jgi:CBS domain-containing protein
MTLGILNAFGGALVQGMWLLLIGWFLSTAARTSYAQLLVRQALENVSVSDVMRTHIAKVEPETTVETVVNDVLLLSDQDCVPVVDPNGTLVGLVRLGDVRDVPKERWASVPVRQIMRVARDTQTLPPDAHAQSALDILAQEDIDQLPVVVERRVLGLVSSRDLLKRLSLRGRGAGAGPIQRPI